MLESLKINSGNLHDADTLLIRRQVLVEQALKQQDLEMLKAISELDKENLILLQTKKNKLAEEIQKITMIKNYLD